MHGQALKGHLDLLLLSVLSAGRAHGYAIVHELSSRSGGSLELAEGTLYPALHRLESAGLLDSDWATVGGRRRRVYELTPAGEQVLARQRGEWNAFSNAVSSVVESV